jgi:hypothetical protein
LPKNVAFKISVVIYLANKILARFLFREINFVAIKLIAKIIVADRINVIGDSWKLTMPGLNLCAIGKKLAVISE